MTNNLFNNTWFNLLSSFLLICDAPDFWQLRLQDSIMERILLFNKHSLFITMIVVLTCWLVFNTIMNFINSIPAKFFYSNESDIFCFDFTPKTKYFRMDNFLFLASLEPQHQLNDYYFFLFWVGVSWFFSALLIKKNNKKLSYFLLFFSFVIGYQCLSYQDLSTLGRELLVYGFSFAVLSTYNYYFVFSSRWCLVTLSVVKQYLIKFEYLKLILWLFLVLVPCLLNNFLSFFYILPLGLFPMLAFRKRYFMLFFFIFQWFWLMILFFFKKFKIFNKLKYQFLNFFGRQGCLHFIGNSPGSRIDFYTVRCFSSPSGGDDDDDISIDADFMPRNKSSGSSKTSDAGDTLGSEKKDETFNHKPKESSKNYKVYLQEPIPLSTRIVGMGAHLARNRFFGWITFGFGESLVALEKEANSQGNKRFRDSILKYGNKISLNEHYEAFKKGFSDCIHADPFGRNFFEGKIGSLKFEDVLLMNTLDVLLNSNSDIITPELKYPLQSELEKIEEKNSNSGPYSGNSEVQSTKFLEGSDSSASRADYKDIKKACDEAVKKYEESLIQNPPGDLPGDGGGD